MRPGAGLCTVNTLNPKSRVTFQLTPLPKTSMALAKRKGSAVVAFTQTPTRGVAYPVGHAAATAPTAGTPPPEHASRASLDSLSDSSLYSPGQEGGARGGAAAEVGHAPPCRGSALQCIGPKSMRSILDSFIYI